MMIEAGQILGIVEEKCRHLPQITVLPDEAFDPLWIYQQDGGDRSYMGPWHESGPRCRTSGSARTVFDDIMAPCNPAPTESEVQTFLRNGMFGYHAHGSVFTENVAESSWLAALRAHFES